MSKSNVILIDAKNNKTCMLLTSEPFDNAALPEFLITKCAKYLGVTFDNSLSFNSHINNLAKKLSRSVRVLTELKPYLNTKAWLSSYYANLPFAYAIWFNHMELNI